MRVYTLIIDGIEYAASGDLTFDTNPFEVTTQTAHNGRNFSNKTARTRMLTIENLMMKPGELQIFLNFVMDCRSVTGFPIAIIADADCDDSGTRRYDFINCINQGNAQHTINTQTTSGFEASFEEVIIT